MVERGIGTHTYDGTGTCRVTMSPPFRVPKPFAEYAPFAKVLKTLNIPPAFNKSSDKQMIWHKKIHEALFMSLGGVLIEDLSRPFWEFNGNEPPEVVSS